MVAELVGQVKSFDAAIADARGEDIVIEFGGERFSIERPLPAIPVANLARQASKSGEDAIGAFLDFAAEVMDEDTAERFVAAVKRERVGLETFIEMVSYVLEEGTGRPTQQRPHSRGGQSSDTPTSPVVAYKAG